MLMEANGFLIASDYPNKIDRGDAELVLWPNPTSRLLLRMTIRRPSHNTLDLGTGTGIEAIAAAAHSKRVIATDLSPRAVEFAAFNARLNGIDNMEVLVGDGFQPVVGRTFDLIVCNPPFFISPSSRYLFSNNHMQLDLLCRQLVREAPNHLNENGYFEMLCEWAQIKGQPWEERLAEWLKDNGCDAWVMKGLTQDPEEYAQHRIRETSPDTSKDAAHYAEYMEYYRRSGVEAIHDGLIVMRRRQAQNFVRIEEVPPTPTGDLGELILSTFAAHDLMREHDTDEKLLTLRPALAPNVRLEQICTPRKGSWQAESLTLRLTSGFPFHVDVQPLAADFLKLCDGTRPASEVIAMFASNTEADPQKVATECLNMIRRLVERGFIVTARKDELAAKTTGAVEGSEIN